MASIGSHKKPAVVRVQTEERARSVLEFCAEHQIIRSSSWLASRRTSRRTSPTSSGPSSLANPRLRQLAALLQGRRTQRRVLEEHQGKKLS